MPEGKYADDDDLSENKLSSPINSKPSDSKKGWGSPAHGTDSGASKLDAKPKWGPESEESKNAKPEDGNKKSSRGPRRNRHKKMTDTDFDDNDESSIPVIPVLEEEEEEEQMSTVAEAPKIRNLRVSSLSELDQDIKYSLPTATEGGIDLSLLTQTLAPQTSLMEEDVEWNFDELLQEVAQEVVADDDTMGEETPNIPTNTTSAKIRVR